MPKLKRAPLREARNRVFDGARWAHYKPRADDIIIATYSKCGTTWTQRIVSMIVLGDAAPRPIPGISPWFDMQLFGPVEAAVALAESQTHRRFLKSHLPYDALPVYEGVKFIHVARDGRDAAMSLHNHFFHFQPKTYRDLDAISLADPKFGDRYPPTPEDPAAFFHTWISDESFNGQGDPAFGFFHMENSYWAERDNPNMLLVHYADLKADRAGEMRRIAKFLGIEISEQVWPSLIEAAGFEAMKRDGDLLFPGAEGVWEGGSGTFFNKGTNGRWQDVYAKADLALYDAKVAQAFSPEQARWVAQGRLARG